MVALFLGPQYDFHIEHKSIDNTFAVQVSRDIAFVYFESALCIGEFRGDFHVVNYKPVKHFGTNPSIQALGFLNMASTHFS
jgi:hypothetical protein